MRQRLSKEDLLNTNHDTVRFVLNIIPEENFIKHINMFIEEIGFEFNNCLCTFSNELDGFDFSIGRIFEGVEFSIDDSYNVVIDYKTFYYYMEKYASHT